MRVLNNHERALLAYQCGFDETIARVNISQFYAVNLFLRHLIILTL